MKQEVPRFGILTNPFMNIMGEIKEIHSLGFDYAEIGIEAPGGMPEILLENRGKILRILGKFKSPPIGHTSWMIDLGTHYDDIREAWIEEGKKSIMVARELGIGLINFHGHSNLAFFERHGLKKRTLDNYVKSLRKLVGYGRGLGVCVMLENMPDKSEISSFADYRYVTDRVRGLGVHLDVSHAYVSDGMKGVRGFISTFKKNILHVHFSDSMGFDDHLPIGKGNIDYEKVVKLLKKIGYDRTITFEIFTDDRKDAVRSRELVKRMWRAE
jgi:sugar phosphate isomerase/epimerase